MSQHDLKYEVLVETALRGMVRQVLAQVAEQGLPGEHFFYITFRTDDPGSDLPDSLRQRYPTEMTIVIQHQFWDLVVEDDHFSITLSFGNVPNQLVIPFAAITAFADPSVEFGLQFDGDLIHHNSSGGTPPQSGPAAAAASSGQDSDPDASDSSDSDESSDDGSDGDDSGDDEHSGKVVTLDRFRKK